MSFEAHLSREMVGSERLRVTILAASFALIALMVILFTWLFRDSPVPFLRSPDALRGILHAMGGLIAYELWVRFVLGHMMRRGKAPPAALRYLNALIETSLPSLLVVMLTPTAAPQSGPAHLSPRGAGPSSPRTPASALCSFRCCLFLLGGESCPAIPFVAGFAGAGAKVHTSLQLNSNRLP